MEEDTIRLIDVNLIDIFNPRVRNKLIAEEINHNIQSVGLKRPITVTKKNEPEGGKIYDLVCGQGRLEAFISAGEKTIPALVVKISKEDACIMGLVENIARRDNSALELLQSVQHLKDKGNDEEAIASKTGLGKSYIHGVFNLLDNGENRLLNSVEKGRMPLYLALKIANEDDAEVQKALADAHESGKLAGGKLLMVQKLLDQRKHYGKGLASFKKKSNSLSAEELVAFYERNVKSKKRLILKAEYVKETLTVASAALRQLLQDIHFSNQLKAEGLHELPQQMATLMNMAE